MSKNKTTASSPRGFDKPSRIVNALNYMQCGRILVTLIELSWHCGSPKTKQFTSRCPSLEVLVQAHRHHLSSCVCACVPKDNTSPVPSEKTRHHSQWSNQQLHPEMNEPTMRLERTVGRIKREGREVAGVRRLGVLHWRIKTVRTLIEGFVKLSCPKQTEILWYIILCGTTHYIHMCVHVQRSTTLSGYIWWHCQLHSGNYFFKELAKLSSLQPDANSAAMCPVYNT